MSNNITGNYLRCHSHSAESIVGAIGPVSIVLPVTGVRQLVRSSLFSENYIKKANNQFSGILHPDSTFSNPIFWEEMIISTLSGDDLDKFRELIYFNSTEYIIAQTWRFDYSYDGSGAAGSSAVYIHVENPLSTLDRIVSTTYVDTETPTLRTQVEFTLYSDKNSLNHGYFFYFSSANDLINVTVHSILRIVHPCKDFIQYLGPKSNAYGYYTVSP